MTTSRTDYLLARDLWAKDTGFYVLLMATMMKADTINTIRLRNVFPKVWLELQARYDAPDARLEGEE